MARVILGLVLPGCLIFQLARINTPPQYPRVGEEVPFHLLQGEHRVLKLETRCVTAFVVSVGCPHCDKLAESFASVQERKSEPIWIVIDGKEAAQAFAEVHSLPPTLVFGMSVPRVSRLLHGREPRIPFTPLRIVLDDHLVVRNLSQRQVVPLEKEKEAFCAAFIG